MPPRTDLYFGIDRTKTLAEEPGTGHNRWHPDIPPIAKVDQGQVIALETRDAFDGQITQQTTSVQAGRFSMGRIHPLTGPVWVNGAEPGDILEVEILQVETGSFAFTLQGPRFGFLREMFTKDHLVRWDIDDGFAESEDLPGVRLPGAPFLGVLGVAPSHELLRTVSRREAALEKRGAEVLLPTPEEAVPADSAIAETGLKSLPPREFAGNVDIKHLTGGAVLRLPVYVPGALFSAGDGHFAQGDNECCTAVETEATLYCSFRVLKGAARARGIDHPEFYRDDYFTSPEMAAPKRFYATTGTSITASGENLAEDLNLAARNALLHMIDHIVDTYSLTRQQAYTLCSVAVDLRINQAVNVPNYLVSAYLPLDIFV